MNKANEMIELAFSNKQVQEKYKKALSDISEMASDGFLMCVLELDPTVALMLYRDGFVIEESLNGNHFKVIWS